jgi:hypothetical protein
MQRIRSYVAVVSLFAMLGLTGSAIAARRNDGGQPVRDEKSQKQQPPPKAKPKGWIKKVLDDLENKFSIPPG